MKPAATALLVGMLVLASAAWSEPIRMDRARSLRAWKRDVTAYSRRHYGEPTWRLRPTCIVLHYTAGRNFPWNLVKSSAFAGERPGLAAHFVIDGRHVWQILPTSVRSRGAYGINHRAINVEMVAASESDLAGRTATLQACANLVRALMRKYSIPARKIYAHSDVARMDPARVPEIRDLINAKPYDKKDPGASVMRRIRTLVVRKSK